MEENYDVHEIRRSSSSSSSTSFDEERMMDEGVPPMYAYAPPSSSEDEDEFIDVHSQDYVVDDDEYVQGLCYHEKKNPPDISIEEDIGHHIHSALICRASDVRPGVDINKLDTNLREVTYGHYALKEIIDKCFDGQERFKKNYVNLIREYPRLANISDDPMDQSRQIIRVADIPVTRNLVESVIRAADRLRKEEDEEAARKEGNAESFIQKYRAMQACNLFLRLIQSINYYESSPYDPEVRLCKIIESYGKMSDPSSQYYERCYLPFEEVLDLKNPEYRVLNKKVYKYFTGRSHMSNAFAVSAFTGRITFRQLADEADSTKKKDYLVSKIGEMYTREELNLQEELAKSGPQQQMAYNNRGGFRSKTYNRIKPTIELDPNRPKPAFMMEDVVTLPNPFGGSADTRMATVTNSAQPQNSQQPVYNTDITSVHIHQEVVMRAPQQQDSSSLSSDTDSDGREVGVYSNDSDNTKNQNIKLNAQRRKEREERKIRKLAKKNKKLSQSTTPVQETPIMPSSVNPWEPPAQSNISQRPPTPCSQPQWGGDAVNDLNNQSYSTGSQPYAYPQDNSFHQQPPPNHQQQQFNQNQQYPQEYSNQQRQGYAPPPLEGFAPPPSQGYAPPPLQGYDPPPITPGYVQPPLPVSHQYNQPPSVPSPQMPIPPQQQIYNPQPIYSQPPVRQNQYPSDITQSQMSYNSTSMIPPLQQQHTSMQHPPLTPSNEQHRSSNNEYHHLSSYNSNPSSTYQMQQQYASQPPPPPSAGEYFPPSQQRLGFHIPDGLRGNQSLSSSQQPVPQRHEYEERAPRRNQTGCSEAPPDANFFGKPTPSNSSHREEAQYAPLQPKDRNSTVPPVSHSLYDGRISSQRDYPPTYPDREYDSSNYPSSSAYRSRERGEGRISERDLSLPFGNMSMNSHPSAPSPAFSSSSAFTTVNRGGHQRDLGSRTSDATVQTGDIYEVFEAMSFVECKRNHVKFDSSIESYKDYIRYLVFMNDGQLTFSDLESMLRNKPLSTYLGLCWQDVLPSYIPQILYRQRDGRTYLYWNPDANI